VVVRLSSQREHGSTAPSWRKNWRQKTFAK